ncbi:MAG: glycine betaine ABC transporter substrate-binding protein, partial [Planctomycetota bacterium]
MRATPRSHSEILVTFAGSVSVLAAIAAAMANDADERAKGLALRGALIRPEDAGPERLDELKSNGTNTVAFALRGADEKRKRTISSAVAQAKRAGLEFAYWIEVARSPELAEAHPELKTLEGIKANPELVGGRFHDCPSGWGCDITNHNNFKAADLADAGVERFQHGSGETLATAIAAAYEAKEPWFGYYWAPTSVLGKYPMVQVEMPAYDADTHTCNGLEDCATPGLSAYHVSNVVTA